jgi:hypothetical protein
MSAATDQMLRDKIRGKISEDKKNRKRQNRKRKRKQQNQTPEFGSKKKKIKLQETPVFGAKAKSRKMQEKKLQRTPEETEEDEEIDELFDDDSEISESELSDGATPAARTRSKRAVPFQAGQYYKLQHRYDESDSEESE